MHYHIAASDKVEDHGHALGVWLRNFPNPTRFIKRYDWYYCRNPRTVYSFLLKDDSGPIGAAGLAERRFGGAASAYSVGLCSDFVVDKSRRSVGPALQLQRWVMKTGLQRFAFLYGFPNIQALAVMRRAGYHQLGELSCYTMAFRSHYYLRRLLPAVIAPWLSRPMDLLLLAWSKASRCFAAQDCMLQELAALDDRFDRLWETSRLKAPFMAQRDRAFLEWRFITNPTDRFKVFGCIQKDGALTGYAVVKIDESGHWRVVDFLACDGKGLISLFAHLVDHARGAGASSMTVGFFGHRLPEKCLRACGFVVRPNRRMIVVATAPAADDGQARLYKKNHWYLTSADEDYN